MTTPDCARLRVELGAYVLGALEPAEESVVREHLASCPDCRAVRDELVPVPRLLSTVTAEQAEHGLAGPPEQGPGDSGAAEHRGVAATLGRIRRERSRVKRRRYLALAAAAVLVVVVGAGGWATSRWVLPAGSVASDAPSATGDEVTWTAQNASHNVNAEVTMVPVPWGTRVRLNLRGVERGKLCHLVIVDRDGTEWSAGSWEVAYDGGVTWSGGVGVRAERIREIVVYLPDQDPLLTLHG